MKATTTVMLVALSVLGAGSVPAQTGESLPRGTRVRITPATPTQVVVGRLVAVSDSALVVRRDRGDITIPRSVIQRIEVSRGTRRHTSAGWGALIGMGIGGVAGFAAGEDSCYGDAWFCIKRPLAALLGGATGVATGSLIGVIVGSFERWSDIAVPMSLSLVPTGEGSMSIGGRIAF